jgi:hypothetical protein
MSFIQSIIQHFIVIRPAQINLNAPELTESQKRQQAQTANKLVDCA